MPDIHTIHVFFSETYNTLYPTVDDGFCVVDKFEKGDKIKFVFAADFNSWRSERSVDIYNYKITIAVPSFVYRLYSNDEKPHTCGKDDGTYDLKVVNGTYIEVVDGGDTIEVLQDEPKGWDGVEFEYDVTVTGNGKTGTLDPRFRGRKR